MKYEYFIVWTNRLDLSLKNDVVEIDYKLDSYENICKLEKTKEYDHNYATLTNFILFYWANMNDLKKNKNHAFSCR